MSDKGMAGWSEEQKERGKKVGRRIIRVKERESLKASKTHEIRTVLVPSPWFISRRRFLPSSTSTKLSCIASFSAFWKKKFKSFF